MVGMDFYDDVTPHRSKKDRKRWCKGKVGREHSYVWIVPNNAYFPCHEVKPWREYRTGKEHGPSWDCSHTYVCENCGRQQFLWMGDPKREDCPDRPEHIPLRKGWRF